MTGHVNGFVQHFQHELGNPNIVAAHCMAHLLEPFVKDAMKAVPSTTHLWIFLDDLYTFCSRFPKNEQEVQDVAKELNTSFIKLGKSV